MPDEDDQFLELNKYISSTLVELLKGIQSAQKDKTVGKFIAPAVIGKPTIDPAYKVAHHEGKMFTTVDFDVSVVVENTRNIKDSSKAGILAPVVAAFSLETENSDAQKSMHRLQFAVHVELPSKEDSSNKEPT